VAANWSCEDDSRCQQAFFGEDGTSSVLQPIPRPENPPDHGQADEQEEQRHAEADAHIDIGELVEAPAEAADEINDRVDSVTVC
jgi:hypothetical protein